MLNDVNENFSHHSLTDCTMTASLCCTIKTVFIFQVYILTLATEWRTATEALVLPEAQQWTFIVCTILTGKTWGQDFGSVLTEATNGCLVKLKTFVMIPSMQVVFRSLKKGDLMEYAPICKSVTWEKMMKAGITSDSEQDFFNGGAFYLEHFWL